MALAMYDIIERKKRGGKLSDSEINELICSYTSGKIPDYQMSALLMAICFVGMDDVETLALTNAMRFSGEVADLSAFGGFAVDKHSTGGVGDKTSLVVAPVVAACGAKLLKMSGRGLGHTGGTVDKLESIPGFRTDLNVEEFTRVGKNVGVAVIGQSGNFAPADKKLYALRDVTATVDCVPLIASSIMSKKLAAGADSIVLDVKTGSGAFMKTVEQAQALAEKMVAIGKSNGKKIAALITNMDIPLGHTVGNAIEVLEAVDVLKDGRNASPQLYDICVALASQMLSLCFGKSVEECKTTVCKTIDSGIALGKFTEWIEAQSGDTTFVRDYGRIFHPAFTLEVKAEQRGWISHTDTEKVGLCACALGAGRAKKDDVIDYSAGIKLIKTTGDFAEKGETLAVLYTDRESTLSTARDILLTAYTVSDTTPPKSTLIYKTIQ